MQLCNYWLKWRLDCIHLCLYAADILALCSPFMTPMSQLTQSKGLTLVVLHGAQTDLWDQTETSFQQIKHANITEHIVKSLTRAAHGNNPDPVLLFQKINSFWF